MSNWSSTQLTDLGRALDAKVTAGTTLLSFTKMKLGSGTETAEDIPAMTDLVSPKLVLGISSCAVSASDDTICELISVASSSDVEDSFVVRELGVFATDPDVGEILYAVMLDSTPDTMQNENVSSPVTVAYQVNIVSDNASSITAVIDPAGLVNVATLDAAIADFLTREMTPAFNKRDVVTTSSTYTAPVTGEYKITIKGGGQGGQGGGYAATARIFTGTGGNEATTATLFLKISAGETIPVVIGAGGTGGNSSTSGAGTTGAAGGISSVTINGTTYDSSGTGISTNGYVTSGALGVYGIAAIAPGTYQTTVNGGRGGNQSLPGGGGEGGWSSYQGAVSKGGNGKDGVVWFEYFDPSL